MAGRIKLLKNGVPIVIEDDPPLGYEYESPSKLIAPYLKIHLNFACVLLLSSSIL